MYVRSLIKVISNDLKIVPAVVLYGPRQVGKTTMVKQLAATNPDKFLYLDMELPSDRLKLSEPELFLNGLTGNTVILDEVQFLPDLFPVLRSLIDKDRRPGRFLLLGSASPVLIQKSSESLAGRVRYRELFPFTLPEVVEDNLNELWFKGGFPEAFLSEQDKDAMDWYAHFIRSYVTRDLALFGLSMPPVQIERLLQMLAHTHGQIINFSNLSRSLGVSQPTITNAMYYLEEALLIRTLKPWHTIRKKRLIKTPKVYIRDSGMLHHLLGIQNYNRLLGHPQAGNSWEGFVIQQILSVLPANIQTYFYRTAAGAELDLLLVRGDKVIVGMEIKMSTAPELTRGNTEAINDVEPEFRTVISNIKGSYPLKDNWKNYGLDSFLKSLGSDPFGQ